MQSIVLQTMQFRASPRVSSGRGRTEVQVSVVPLFADVRIGRIGLQISNSILVAVVLTRTLYKMEPSGRQ